MKLHAVWRRRGSRGLLLTVSVTEKHYAYLLKEEIGAKMLAVMSGPPSSWKVRWPKSEGPKVHHRSRKHESGVDSATSRDGTALLDSMELLHDVRQRAAIEVIQEERTAHRDPEDRDGDLPQLEGPPANSN